MLAPELEAHVTAHRQPAEYDRFIDTQFIEHRDEVVGHLLHGCRAAQGLAAAETTQVRRDHLKATREQLDLRVPHRVVQRKAMHQEHRHSHAAPHDLQLDLAGLHLRHNSPVWLCGDGQTARGKCQKRRTVNSRGFGGLGGQRLAKHLELPADGRGIRVELRRLGLILHGIDVIFLGEVAVT